MNLEWEEIDGYHERAKTFGGWLVKAYSHTDHAQLDNGYWSREQSQEMQVAMTFVPDVNYEWEIK